MSEPKRNAPVSGARGMNMHQKMEDARARRAEAMSLKQPANDDVSVSIDKSQSNPAPALDSEPSPAVALAQAPEPESPARTRSKPRSRALSEARFPEILMPPEDEDQPGQDIRRPMVWGATAVLLLALLVGTIYVVQ